MSTEGGDELGHPLVTLQPAEPLGRLLKPDRHPAKNHSPILPSLDVVMNTAKNAIEILDRIRGDQRALESIEEADREDGESLLQTLSQRCGRARVPAFELPSELVQHVEGALRIAAVVGRRD